MKLFDIPLTLGGIVNYCDSDILFLRPFNQLFVLPDNVSMLHMLDHINAATIRPWHLRPFGSISLIEKFNSGITVFDSSFYNLDIIESFLRDHIFCTSVGSKRFTWTEQTCWAVLCSSLKCRHLDPSKFPIAHSKLFNALDAIIGIHFVTPQRFMINRKEIIDLEMKRFHTTKLVTTFPSYNATPLSLFSLDIRQSFSNRFKSI